MRHWLRDRLQRLFGIHSPSCYLGLCWCQR